MRVNFAIPTLCFSTSKSLFPESIRSFYLFSPNSRKRWSITGQTLSEFAIKWAFDELEYDTYEIDQLEATERVHTAWDQLTPIIMVEN
jgi:hypothetical protein